MRRTFGWLFAATLLGSLVHACTCGLPAGGRDGGEGGGAGAAGGGTAGGLGGNGGGAASCTPSCATGQFCSATAMCVDAGSCAVTDDCTVAGTICDPATHTCVPGSSCGSTEVTGGVAAPNLFIELDRSCSMKTKVGGASKWEIAVGAIKQITDAYKGKVRFGLALFPDTVTPDCEQAAIPIPLGPDKETSINALLQASLLNTDPNYPDGPCVTNIDTGIKQASSDPALLDPTRKSYVLLLTDGMQSGCNAGGGDDGTAAAISALRVQHGVSTFVVAFGAGGIDKNALTNFADAGGVPAPPDAGSMYYHAEDKPSLEAALNSIGSRTLSCTYNLTQVPPDPSKLFVFFDNTRQILQNTSHADGWDYDAAKNQVNFYGPACDALKNGKVADLDIVFGCAKPNLQ